MSKCSLCETGQALFQLKFGPFEHCSQWHHDEVKHSILFTKVVCVQKLCQN